ncbi:MAG: hypothetical protein ABI999_06595, partial [Acidobacteriota bacterium]
QTREVVMRYLKRISAIISLMVVIFAAGALCLQAQVRGGRRVVIVRPAFHGGFYRHYGFYDPFYDPYYCDPYLQAQREE